MNPDRIDRMNTLATELKARYPGQNLHSEEMFAHEAVKEFSGLISESAKSQIDAILKNFPSKFRSDGDDICQQATLKALRKFALFSGESLFSTWLYRVTKNTAIDYTKRPEAKHQHLSQLSGSDGDGNHEPTTGSGYDPVEIAANHEDVERYTHALHTLPPEQRVTMGLKITGSSNKDIATYMGATEPTVRTRLHRATKALQEIMCRGGASVPRGR